MCSSIKFMRIGYIYFMMENRMEDECHGVARLLPEEATGREGDKYI